MADPVIKNDVFVSYSRNDATRAELLAARLTQEAGLRVWLDKARLQPGFSWRAEIETAMNESATALIVWGTQDLGPVQRQERDLAYAIRDTRTDFRVIYAFLPETQLPKGTWASVDTWIRFESSLDEPDAFAQIVAALKGEAPPTPLVAELPDDPAPYRGLAAFGVEDTRFFFGRTTYVHEMLERLPHHPFLAVIGPSGSGKTSVVQAGLLARLQTNAIPGSDTWRQSIVRPGPNPLRALATALTRLSPARDSLTAIDTLLERLQTNPSELPEIIQSLLPSKGPLILVVDRLEELFTLCEGEDNRRSFLQAVLALINHPHHPAWVVVTMRADFYGHLGRYSDLASEVVHHQLYIRAMSAKEVAEIIEAPTTQVGAIFEKGLAAQIRTDAQVREEVALPLLQHTLDLVWRKRRGRWLTWDAYKEIGGISGALRYHADRVIEGLGPDERELARRLLLRLIWLEEGAGVLAGRRVEKPGLVQQFHDPAAAERLLQRLADERLVALRAEGEQATAELVHDSLPLHWDRLQQWVQGDREFLLWRQRLRSALAEWDRTSHDVGVLLRGALLAEAERWLAERRDDLTAAEQRFIEKSVTQREQEQAALDRRRRRVTYTAAAAAIVFLTLAALAALQWWRAEEQRTQALISQSKALSSVSRQQTDKGLATLGMLLALEALPKQDGENRSFVPSAEAALLYAIFNQREKQILRDHTDAVNLVRFSPDGTLIVTASRDRTARVWQVNEMGVQREPIVLQGHNDSVYHAIFSPDGTRVVTASGDNTARIWWVSEAEGQGEPIVLQGHTDSVNHAIFSYDGTRVVTASGDNTARVWLVSEPEGQGEPIVLQGHTDSVNHAIFSYDGTRVVTASDDKTARLWDADTGKELAMFQGHNGAVYKAVFSPDGQQIITTSWDHTARLWDGLTGKLIATLQGHKEGVEHAAFSPDGQLVVTTSADNTVRLWDGVTGKAAAVFEDHQGQVYDAQFSPNGDLLVTASDDGTARIWDLASRTAIAILRGHFGPVWSASFSSDDQLVVTASEDNTVRIWDASPNKTLARLVGHKGYVYKTVFSSNGARLVTVSQDGTARIWNAKTGDTIAILTGHEGEVWHAAFSPDDQSLVTASMDGTARIWDVDTGSLITILRGHKGWVGHAHFSPDGHLLVTASEDKTARIWDVASGKTLAILQGHNGPINLAEFSNDGSRIVTASDDHTARIWDATRCNSVQGDHLCGKLITTITGHQNRVVFAAFSPDDTRVATASGDGTARLWDTGSGDSLAVLRGHKNSVWSAAFSPDGRRIITTSWDNTAHIWDVSEEKSLFVLLEHEGRVVDGSFSPDGRLVITAAWDGAARLWHADSGRLVSKMKGHGNYYVVSAVFAPDGQHVATASWDHTARLWKLPIGAGDDWIMYARDTVPRKLTDDERRLYLGD